MDIEGGTQDSAEEIKKEFQAPVTNRILRELIDLHPHMVGGDPGAPERVIYAQALGLGGGVVYPSKRSFRQ